MPGFRQAQPEASKVNSVSTRPALTVGSDDRRSEPVIGPILIRLRAGPHPHLTSGKPRAVSEFPAGVSCHQTVRVELP